MAQSALSDLLLRRSVTVQRMTASEVKKVDDLLRSLDSQIRFRLSGQELTDIDRNRLERALERVDSYLADQFKTYRQDILSDLHDIAQNEADFTGKALSASIDAEFAVPADATLRAAALSTPLGVTGADGGKLLGAFLTDWSTTETNRITNAIRLGVAQGQTNAQIVQVIRGTKAANYSDGIIALTKQNADKVVHTAVQFVANVARNEVFAANDDIVDQVQWISTLDSRTCPRCGALDGQTFELDKGPRPPLHILCRCSVIAALNPKYATLSKGRTRPAVGDDGAEQVSGSTTYFSWLKQQPASFQDFALGPTRGKLLRDGGLSASRFAQLQLDKNFQPLTLAEAKKLEPIAFDEANVGD